MAHHGTQEPYLLEHNYKPVIRNNETKLQFKNRIKEQLPNVHWRLDKPDVISKSNIKGSFTEANVGAAQNMLLSVGTKTKKHKISRSPNFLGKYYQEFLSNPEKLKKLVNRKPGKNEVYEITRTEIDALDTTLKDFANLNGNTKLLLCLINNLKKDKNFTLISKYIFSPQKMLSLAAIYNDLGMIPSIGQISVEKGKTTADGFSRFNFNEIGKPGQALIRTVDDDGNVTSITTGILSQAYNPITGTTLNYDTEGAEPAPLGAWAHPDDRKRGIFFKEWDNWDKVLLRNSTSRIKRLFKTYYNSRFYDNDNF